MSVSVYACKASWLEISSFAFELKLSEFAMLMQIMLSGHFGIYPQFTKQMGLQPFRDGDPKIKSLQ